MASNLAQATIPYLWCSANDDVIYTFDFIAYLMDPATNSGGNVRLQLVGNFDIQPIPGEYIYVDSNIYRGTYKVLDASTTYVTIDFPYSSSITGGIYYCYHLRVPIFTLYKGCTGSEPFIAELPYGIVSTIKPVVIYYSTGIPYIEINVKGLTKYLFNIVANTVANSVDFSMFNVIRLGWDSLLTTGGNSLENYTAVLNCALTNDELQYDKIVGGIYLTPVDYPLIATQGTTFASIIDGNIANYRGLPVPYIHKFVNGILQ